MPNTITAAPAGLPSAVILAFPSGRREPASPARIVAALTRSRTVTKELMDALEIAVSRLMVDYQYKPMPADLQKAYSVAGCLINRFHATLSPSSSELITSKQAYDAAEALVIAAARARASETCS